MPRLYGPRGIARIERRGLRCMLVYRIGQERSYVQHLGHFHSDVPAVRAAQRVLRRLVYERRASSIDLDKAVREHA